MAKGKLMDILLNRKSKGLGDGAILLALYYFSLLLFLLPLQLLLVIAIAAVTTAACSLDGSNVID